MKKLTGAGLLASLLIGCAPAADRQAGDSRPAPMGCWEHTITQKGWAPNTLTVCRSESGATQSIYFPNPDSPRQPTTCTQSGTADAKRGVIEFSFRVGDCENGRILGADAMPCTVVSEDELSCTIDDVPGLRFVRTPQAT